MFFPNTLRAFFSVKYPGHFVDVKNTTAKKMDTNVTFISLFGNAQ